MSPSTSSSAQATFCFVDLAGYTALTEAHGDLDACELATRFADLTRSALGPFDRLIKTIGDAVLVACFADAADGASVRANAVRAVEFVRRLLSAISNEVGFPEVRIGLHQGAAVARDGDVFGAAVNLAARVTDRAHGGEVLATAAVAEAAGSLGVHVRPLGSFELKNIREAVALFSLEIEASSKSAVVDPVCRMRVDPRSAVGHLRHDGADFWFCSLSCAAAFAADPARHVVGTK